MDIKRISEIFFGTEEEYIKTLRKKYHMPNWKKAFYLIGTIVEILILLIVLYFLIQPIITKTPVEEYPAILVGMAFSVAILTFLGMIAIRMFSFFRCTKFHRAEKLLLKYYNK
jgi:hypothetical protein